ncbi:MAG: hypothetical protein KY393_09315 [Actinobacteria bacterium]|nr:hypothetical protein [Actinomycetota bacterium]
MRIKRGVNLEGATYGLKRLAAELETIRGGECLCLPKTFSPSSPLFETPTSTGSSEHATSSEPFLSLTR